MENPTGNPPMSLLPLNPITWDENGDLDKTEIEFQIKIFDPETKLLFFHTTPKKAKYSEVREFMKIHNVDLMTRDQQLASENVRAQAERMESHHIKSVFIDEDDELHTQFLLPIGEVDELRSTLSQIIWVKPLTQERRKLLDHLPPDSSIHHIQQLSKYPGLTVIKYTITDSKPAMEEPLFRKNVKRRKIGTNLKKDALEGLSSEFIETDNIWGKYKIGQIVLAFFVNASHFGVIRGVQGSKWLVDFQGYLGKPLVEDDMLPIEILGSGTHAVLKIGDRNKVDHVQVIFDGYRKIMTEDGSLQVQYRLISFDYNESFARNLQRKNFMLWFHAETFVSLRGEYKRHVQGGSDMVRN